MNAQEIIAKLETAVKWPWMTYILSVGAAFLTASILTTMISIFFKPDPTQTNGQNTRKVEIKKFQETPSYLTKTVTKTIVDRNIFNISGEVPQEDLDKKKGDGKPNFKSDVLIKTTLTLKIQGIIYGGDPYSGLVVLEDTSKRSVNSFMVGDTIVKNSKLIEIWENKIIFDMGDHKEYLEKEVQELPVRNRQKKKGSINNTGEEVARYATTPPPDSYKEEGFERQGNDVVLSNDFRQKMLTSDFAKVLQDAKAEPNMVDGELNGFKLTRIREDSIYQKAGLQNSDVVKEVNGVPLTNVAQSIKLLNSLRGENEIEIRLDRDGKSMTLNLQVK